MIDYIGYPFSIMAFAIFVYCFFFTDNAVLNSQAMYWFFTSLISAFIPQIRKFKYNNIEVTLGKKIDILKRKTEEQALKIIATTLDELSQSDYIAELKRIIKKERKKKNDVCLIYADVDNLKDHLTRKGNGRLLRIQVLEFLNIIIEKAANYYKKPYDIYSLSRGEPDRIMIVRKSDIEDGRRIGDYACREFKNKSNGNTDLKVEKNEFLTVSLSVVSIKHFTQKDQDEHPEKIHDKALDTLDEAKNSGKDRVVCYDV